MKKYSKYLIISGLIFLIILVTLFFTSGSVKELEGMSKSSKSTSTPNPTPTPATVEVHYIDNTKNKCTSKDLNKTGYVYTKKLKPPKDPSSSSIPLILQGIFKL